MWPELVVNKLLKKSMGSNNFVADLPPETIFNDTSTYPHEDTIKIFVSSWNVGGVAPSEDMGLIEDWLNTHNNPADIYVLGFQEIVPLRAGNVLGSEKSKIALRWNRMIRAALNKPLPFTAQERSDTANHPNQRLISDFRGYSQDFRCIISKQMVGIFISIWARSDLCNLIRHTNVSCVGCGIMGCLGNKGSVTVRFLLRETSFCFVCSHLASGGREGDERHRNANAAEILLRTTFPGGSSRNLPRRILDHDRVIWLGDFNYRIHLPDTLTRSLVQKQEWNILLQNDELKAELVDGRVFQGWKEGVIKFAPTYKYFPNSGSYYGCNQDLKCRKNRSPAWCDRIIWFGKGLKQSQYERGESRLSDHRPVKAIFAADIEVTRNNEDQFERFF